ncbi:YqaJ viral recombinase domain-containing protein [Gammaproteobacteria bacterium]
MQTTHNAMLMDDESLVIESPTLSAIDQALAQRECEQIPRGHLGMSEIGEPDDRKLWLKFRWSLPDTPSPRILRVFQLGNLIEQELAALLRMIPGLTLHTINPKTGKQFNFQYLGGHFAGSMDGCLIGLPEAPKTWHVWESKSVGHKYFGDLVKKGVKAWNPKYYAQLQCYMGATNLDRALFMAYQKDNSSLYVERVKKEPMFWEGMMAKAERIITRYLAPESSYRDRTWYESKFMSEDAQAVYWGDRLPRPNCRNCRFSEAVMDDDSSRWHCHQFETDLSLEEQKEGCTVGHQFLPCFFSSFAGSVESNQPVAVYRMHEGGQHFANGNVENFDNGTDCVCYSSHELHAMENPKSMITDNFISNMKVFIPGTTIVKTTHAQSLRGG